MNAGNYIDQVPARAVIVVDNGGRLDCTSWGNILTTKAVQKKIAGSVIYGSARDITDIRQMDYPCSPAISIWFLGKTGRG